MIRENSTITDPFSPHPTQTGYILTTSADPLGAFNQFIRAWWQIESLVALLAPVQSPGCCGVFPQVLTDPEQVAMVNPFAPVMPVNSAGLIDELLTNYPQGDVAVILRPCELRTWHEMVKRRAARHNASTAEDLENRRLLLVCVDCPGTLNAVEFAHRTAKDGLQALTDEALEWAAHSRWINNHLRLACQHCEWPIATTADLTIGLLGLDANKLLLVLPARLDDNQREQFEMLVDAPAAEDIWLRRSATAALVTDRRNIFFPGGFRREHDTFSILAAFTRCTMCTDCLDACPLYEGELAGLLGIPGSSAGSAPLLVNLVGVSRWLASCSGCGMCQDACSQDIPLMNIIHSLNQQIRSELDYQPGNPNQPLPWT